ncbi:transposase [Marinoscillum pacificum]|uniref:transposase n=1 Tax=Marinoscillum pacificum TaxID=392723 RepID=UPI002157EA78|nr:transposase [Marinoscillum pacificum]
MHRTVPIPQFSPSSKLWPNQFGPQSKNLASIIRGIKSSVTTQVRKMESDAFSGFAWQSRFHDHIIRDEASYQRISNYIIQNPMNWEKDKLRLL